jgi:hypothetical protein
MYIEDCLTEKGISNEHVKLLIIKGTRKPYLNKQFTIRI